MTPPTEKRRHRFDLYTSFAHLPERLQGYSRPFCEAAQHIWAERGAAHMPDAAEAMCIGIGQSIPWGTAVDPAEADAASELLRKARAQAAHPGTWADERIVARLVRTIIQAKDAWVRANLPEAVLALGDIPLSKRARMGLAGACIETVAQLTSMTRVDLAAFGTIGPKTIDEIERALAGIGLALAGGAS